MRFIWGLLLATLLATSANAADKLKIVTSFSIWADIVQQIGGDQVEVYSLVKPGSDAHAYEPSPQDIVKLQLADLIVLNGLGFEPVLEKVLQAQQLQSKVLIVTQNIQPLLFPADQKTPDPHIWHDPRRVAQVIESITQKLSMLKPAAKAEFSQHAENLKREILTLHNWAQQQFTAIPVAQRKILTSHDAFQYLGNTYQLTLLPLQGLNTNQEPTPQHIASVIQQIKAGQVRAIFMEKNTNPKLLQAMAQETGVPVSGKLYADSLSDAHGEATSWQEMFRYNVKVISQALQTK